MTTKSTQPCYVCNGFGSRASDEAYMMMHTEPCAFCKGTGKLDMLGRALETPPLKTASPVGTLPGAGTRR
jgi:DnaJ-class molecular chaperone